ncbi:hypothetical protein [Kytococcus sedentarius]|uniref:hypothetical protein n=1 Tax=Kytococcus sedentarius TaxID=1276 RepID=UPI0035BC6F5C
MNLHEIVTSYAAALAEVDECDIDPGVNRRTGLPYRLGVKALSEARVLHAVSKAEASWAPGTTHEVDVACHGETNIRVDHVLSRADSEDRWGVEVKRLQFCGDNGKVNDYAVGKVLSPYLKDRGVLHDALRLQRAHPTDRCAVLVYGFDYDASTLDEAARRHEGDVGALGAISNLRKTIDAEGPLRNRPLIEFADAILTLRGLVRGPRAEASFEAWKHPLGGTGVVFGWEVRTPETEPDFDPRHPW